MRTRALGSLVLAAGLAAQPAAAGSWQDLLGKTLDPVPTEKPAQTEQRDGEQLDTATVAGGLKDALRLAVTRTTERVGRPGGFGEDPDIHIPLPKTLRTVQDTLERVGMAGTANELENRLNRAAEQAAPEARDILIDAAMQMQLADARKILTGPDDAATQYFRRTSSEELRAALRPIVDEELADAGALQTYEQIVQAYDEIPFVSAPTADMTGYTVGKALDGIFHYVAKEEARIRENPAARTTSLLKTVFGG
ncbi:Protein of unknown function [Limimonas halophila]|uniref:DUF4197 domain-containing protein n=1 Tax=Limimonas halophila TaxID=1082479 RepID=A0A1G7LHL1_9PROT|nr:DUF4197 domain-containing protein [Limimonas halophila]SDF48824.1 Protein of unknown function [Limimonas halophila]